MKTLAGAADRVRPGRQARNRAGRAAHQVGGGEDHARLVARAHDFVDRRPFAADGGFPGGRASPGDRQDVAKRLGQEHGVAAHALANKLVELAAVAPGCLVQVVSGEQDGAGLQATGVAQCAQGLDGGGDAAFHIGRPAAGEQAVLDPGRRKREMHRVEVAVELQRRARALPLSSRTTTAGAAG